jgi:hypothetical protein
MNEVRDKIVGVALLALGIGFIVFRKAIVAARSHSGALSPEATSRKERTILICGIGTVVCALVVLLA